jgi:alpha-L-rhamnosidase
MSYNIAKWIWYPGDFEIYHALKLNCRREERGFVWPAYWRLDDCWHNVLFRRKCILIKPEEISVTGNGIGYFSVDGKKYSYGSRVVIEPGEHLIQVSAAKIDGLPSVFIRAGEFSSDERWEASYLTRTWLPSGCNNMYNCENDNPEIFRFNYQHLEPASKEENEKGTLYDFGVQTFARLCFDGITGNQPIRFFYGESETEALDTDFSYIRDVVPALFSEYICKPRAFRYVFIPRIDTQYNIHSEYEYVPFDKRGFFRCSDDKINKIWDTAVYTFHLNSREFFLDGIKRDRWVWSGDAYQSYLINYYLFFDTDICKRTIIALRGKDPIEQHINTIMDYSLLWILSIWDYYTYTGDVDFVRMIYPRMKSMMGFCQSRTDEEGFMAGFDDDWVFIDWADIDKTGAVCAEQMLFARSLEISSECAILMGEDGSGYLRQAKLIRMKIDSFFWNEKLGAYIDSYESGKNNVTRHANIFAIIFGFADDNRKVSIIKNVILNEKIPQITTPYFKFYELDALCRIGKLGVVLQGILEYWGGMLDMGATTFWEEYSPKADFPEHYEMYGDKYGKSLCHAWGASPIYLLGKYFLGVRPTATGYDRFEVTPRLDGLEWIEGKVPIPCGTIYIYMDKTLLRVCSSRIGGTLILGKTRLELPADEEIEILL